MRLNQFLAKSLGMSRRQADTLIQAGDVEVDGELGQFYTKVTERGSKVRIHQDGKWKPVFGKKRNTTLLMYKPIFTLVTKHDPQKRKTIFDTLPPKYTDLKPAGRLDYLSEGLLVLSDNGELLNELTHPKHETEKKYLVGLNAEISEENKKKMESGGLALDEYELVPVQVQPVSFEKEEDSQKGTGKPKKRRAKKDEESINYSHLRFLKPQRAFVWYQFTLKEGRKNQIRRMCELFGYSVRRLIRVQHGRYTLDQRLYTSKAYEVKGR